jgi:hypothetical protein
VTQLSKKPVEIAVKVCALLASVAIAGALWAYFGSGEAGPIRVESPKSGVRFESIEMHLFVLPGFMVLVLAVVAHALFRWASFSRKVTLDASYYRANFENFRHFDLPLLVQTVCIATCLIQSIALFISLYRSLKILMLL